MQIESNIELEIDSLFDIVKLQAKAYQDAFEIFQSEKADFFKIKDDYLNKINLLNNEAKTYIDSIQLQINGAIQTFEQKTEKIEIIYNSLDRIHSLHDELSSLFRQTESSFHQLDRQTAHLISTATSNFLNLENQLREQINVKSEGLKRRIDLRFALKSKNIEGRFRNLSDSIDDLDIHFHNQISTINDELDLLKQHFGLLNETSMQLRHEVLKKITILSGENELNRERKNDSDTKKLEQNNIYPGNWQNSSLSDQMYMLETKVEELTNKFNRSKTIFPIIILGFFISIVAMLILFFLIK